MQTIGGTFLLPRSLLGREVTRWQRGLRLFHQLVVMAEALEAVGRQVGPRREREHHEKGQGDMRDRLEFVILDGLDVNLGARSIADQDEVVALLDNHRSGRGQRSRQGLPILHHKFIVERVEKRVLGLFAALALGVKWSAAEPRKRGNQD